MENIEVKLLDQFRKKLIEFLDDIIEQVDQFPEIKGNLITLRIFISDQMPIVDIMNNFLLYIIPHKTEINCRNDVFFMGQKKFFSNISPKTIQDFKKLWRSDIFDSEDKEKIWKWVDLFVIIAEKYQKVKTKEKI